jgi:hypothetical protein
MRKTTITLNSGNTIQVSSLQGGDAPMFGRFDEAVLFCDRPDGTRLWQNADLPGEFMAYDKHDALVAAVTADPARFIPNHEDWY